MNVFYIQGTKDRVSERKRIRARGAGDNRRWKSKYTVNGCGPTPSQVARVTNSDTFREGGWAGLTVVFSGIGDGGGFMIPIGGGGCGKSLASSLPLRGNVIYNRPFSLPLPFCIYTKFFASLYYILYDSFLFYKFAFYFCLQASILFFSNTA